jgi:hypothetical protein
MPRLQLAKLQYDSSLKTIFKKYPSALERMILETQYDDKYYFYETNKTNKTNKKNKITTFILKHGLQEHVPENITYDYLWLDVGVIQPKSLSISDIVNKSGKKHIILTDHKRVGTVVSLAQNVQFEHIIIYSNVNVAKNEKIKVNFLTICNINFNCQMENSYAGFAVTKDAQQLPQLSLCMHQGYKYEKSLQGIAQTKVDSIIGINSSYNSLKIYNNCPKYLLLSGADDPSNTFRTKSSEILSNDAVVMIKNIDQSMQFYLSSVHDVIEEPVFGIVVADFPYNTNINRKSMNSHVCHFVANFEEMSQSENIDTIKTLHKNNKVMSLIRNTMCNDKKKLRTYIENVEKVKK